MSSYSSENDEPNHHDFDESDFPHQYDKNKQYKKTKMSPILFNQNDSKS